MRAKYILALADAMQLHDERVRLAIARARTLRAELEHAEAHQRAVMEAREAFKNGIASADTKEAGRG